MSFNTREEFNTVMARCKEESSYNFNRFERIQDALKPYEEHNLYCFIHPPSSHEPAHTRWLIQICLTIDTKEQLTEILRSIRSVLDEPLKYVAPSNKGGDPYWEQPGLLLSTYLGFKNCRKVEVGTKVVPVYEVVCDDYAAGEENSA